ncbi:hypothetical protein B0O99DRAFT_288168 [Bisporella sp. PMI_857]|nr:hypothetical protein B0O99DRAFT_288168 [Bisporella sp. PMI_857]
MLLTIYLVKGSILFMYSKMTTILPTTEHLKYLGGYIVAGFIATEGTFFTACRPFRGYWAMPPPDPQCTTLENYAIVQAVFNISSDIMMLCWILPILWSTKLAAPQKSVCLGLFGLGIFVIIAALLTKVFNLTDVYSPNYMRWYTRESSVAIYMSNIPWIWPELKRWIPCLQRMFPDIQGVGYDSLGRTSSSRRTSCGPERYSQSFMLENIRGSPTVVQGGISLAVQHRIRAHREIENELLRRTPSETELDQGLHTRNYSTETGDNLEVQPNSIKKRTTVRIEISNRDVIEPAVERGLGNSAQDTTLDSETEVASTISNGKYTEIGASSPVNDKRVGKQDFAPHQDEISNTEKDDKPAKQDKDTEPTKI